MSDLNVGLIVAVVSMLGTLLALGVLALCIYALHRFLPDRGEPQAPALTPPSPPTPAAH